MFNRKVVIETNPVKEDKHIFYMQRAVDLAKQAAFYNEVPIGALIVNNQTGEIIAEAYNKNEENNCTQHAEILVIQKSCEILNVNRLRGMDIYVTLEPCTMCAAAISFARIDNIYFGAYDEKGGAVVNGVKFYESPTCHHKPNVKGGILEEECSKILKNFFQNKRKKG